MLIHSASDEENNPIENLLILLCQSSLHTALHFSFILFAALEDYQPEDMRGKPNPNANHVIFSNCARVLGNTERAVVLGDVASLLQTSAEPSLHDAYRQASAYNIVKSSREESPKSPTASKSGPLLFKRVERKSLVRKQWKERWFRIDQKVLHCYQRSDFTTLLRTMPLQDCKVDIVSNPHHDNCFEVFSRITGTLFQLQARSKEEMLQWIEAINA
jgi:hypothetical protein